MSTLTLNSRSTPVMTLISDIEHGHVVLWRSVIGLALATIVFVALGLVDQRLFNGINVWDKPAKFALSLGVQLATVSWAIRQLPQVKQAARGIGAAVWAMTAFTWLELAYIAWRASRAEASHFNADSAFAIVAYGIMGVGAVTITAAAGYIGYLLWRERKTSLMVEAGGVGLMIGMFLGTLAGGYMSSHTGHWVGGEMSDANGLGFFSWSTTGGDLRPAHFLGLHAAQIIPFAALAGDRLVVYGMTMLVVIATAALFALGVSGIPLLRG